MSAVLADGHAGWSESGTDIVCAAVSAILQTAWVGLTDHAGVAVDGERTAGRLVMRWPAEAFERPDVRAIVLTAQLGVRGVAAAYPDRVRVAEERSER